MRQKSEIDDPRRLFLVRLLAAGAFALTLPFAAQRRVHAEVPGPMPPGRSIYKLKGNVRVNGQAASLTTPISAGDLIETGADGFVIFVVGQDAFILRAGSSLQLSAASAGNAEDGAVKRTAVSLMRLATGKVLSVFGKGEHTIATPTASIGIRGTGIYVESDPDETYVCTCYGTAAISAAGDPASTETVVSTHHSAPRYVSASGDAGQRIRPAPFKDHSDEELLLIETLVGRTTPFVVPGRTRARRRNY